MKEFLTLEKNGITAKFELGIIGAGYYVKLNNFYSGGWKTDKQAKSAAKKHFNQIVLKTEAFYR